MFVMIRNDLRNNDMGRLLLSPRGLWRHVPLGVHLRLEAQLPVRKFVARPERPELVRSPRGPHGGPASHLRFRSARERRRAARA